MFEFSQVPSAGAPTYRHCEADVVTHEREFLAHLGGLQSADRYVRFLRDVSEATGVTITPKSLRSDDDIERLAGALSGRYAEKSIANYRSVMRRYVEMVEERGL